MNTKLDFKKTNGLIPAVIQDYKTNVVYMLGYVSEESLAMTIQTGFVHFYSRSRKKIWLKGEESGNKLKVIQIQYDCDADSILITVELYGTHVCHTGSITCFHTQLPIS